MGPDSVWWHGWWILPMSMPVLIVMILVAVLYFLLRNGAYGPDRRRDSDRPSSNTGDSESAIEILSKRYAKGEIKREEFEQMKKDLNS